MQLLWWPSVLRVPGIEIFYSVIATCILTLSFLFYDCVKLIVHFFHFLIQNQANGYVFSCCLSRSCLSFSITLEWKMTWTLLIGPQLLLTHVWLLVKQVWATKRNSFGFSYLLHRLFDELAIEKAHLVPFTVPAYLQNVLGSGCKPRWMKWQGWRGFW